LVSAMLAGAAPVDITPALKANGWPVSVEPLCVPMNPKVGVVLVPKVDDPSAASPTAVTAPSDPVANVPARVTPAVPEFDKTFAEAEAVKCDPATRPPVLRKLTPAVPTLLSTFADPEVVKNEPTRSPPVLRKEEAPVPELLNTLAMPLVVK